jgi:hypothetical protein
MYKYIGHKFTQVATCLLCTAVAWRYESIIGPLEGTEFGGGWLTGPLLHLYDIGAVLLFIALLLVFFFRRIAAVITILASLLCLPLYLYFTAPGPFRRIFYWVYFESPIQSSFRWNTEAVVGILTLAIAAYVGFRSFLAARGESLDARTRKS